ncbi:MAG TPA: bifunctional phosphoribosylaminoimidazolecarboxamide formyltransferase/IMP cyclohydrolase [Bacillota bacterium]|jgi:phosphoribosylaminoimidazolecarboxamide formyltransferase/IMP cyclohydrolase|nr:bifunctional phosphoribosylaminoimidazolecarboxamide formyltransferase/IMP cyclohydrolase [Bacillota bacterium]
MSVYDKEGVVEFGRALADLGFEIISTGGTASALRRAGLGVTDVSQVTGFPEVLDGRVKTLHPRVHAGILARPTPEHMQALEELDVVPIDIVAVNLYPFQHTVDSGADEAEIVENIDIGGPSMARAAAKNFERVAVIVDPADYPVVVAELRENGSVSGSTRVRLAAAAFQHTAAYDAAIARYFADSMAGVPRQCEQREADEGREAGQTGLAGGEREAGQGLGREFTLGGVMIQTLRYGENPHQMAAFYRSVGERSWGLAAAKQLGGKELSFNNIGDADAAVRAVAEFDETAVVIVKHANPCGIGVGANVAEAYRAALDSDPVSAFGGIAAFNRPVDLETARLMSEIFLEVIIAPGFVPEAVELLHGKKNLRLLELAVDDITAGTGWDVRSVAGGFLVQEPDRVGHLDMRGLPVVTRRAPDEGEMVQLANAWKAVAHVKSNAIVLWRGNGTVGVGAGQMNRVGSARIAMEQAGQRAEGSVMASDAFFPFPDTVEVAAKAGVTAIIQPGGSLRDKESVQVADAHGIAMVFTGRRHFRH